MLAFFSLQPEKFENLTVAGAGELKLTSSHPRSNCVRHMPNTIGFVSSDSARCLWRHLHKSRDRCLSEETDAVLNHLPLVSDVVGLVVEKGGCRDDEPEGD